MKYLICTVLYLFVSSVVQARTEVDDIEELEKIQHYEYAENGTVCILADFEATFNLTVTYQGKTYNKTFEMAPKVNITGSCANHDLPASLILSTSAEEMEFTVMASPGSPVKADLQYLLTDLEMTFPQIHFKGLITLVGQGYEFPDMGNVNSSYLCNTAKVIELKSNDTTNVTATILVTFTDFKFQAFNVDGNYSKEVIECEADQTTTPVTPTTTLPPPKGRGNYTVENGTGTVCLRMDANITIEIKMNGTSRHVMVPATASVNGTCGMTMSTMTLDFIDDEVMTEEEKTTGNITFNFLKKKNFAFIDSVEVDLVFANETNGTVHLEMDVNDVLTGSNMFYTCKEEDLDLGGGAHVMLQDLQVQAFGLDNGAFSKNGFDCATVPKQPTDANFTVSNGGVTCISLTAALQLVVPYNKTTGADKATINITRDQPAEGSCGTNGSMSENIIIWFDKENFMIRFDFAKEPSSSMLSADKDFSYFVQNITVMYTMTEIYFPDAKNMGESVTVREMGQTLYKTAGNQYYKCDTDQTISLPDGVNLVTKDFKFVAFHTDPTPPDLNSGSANECAADTETNSIVPIAVGAALAGLVVIVLIAYLIGRRRSHKGYESV